MSIFRPMYRAAILNLIGTSDKDFMRFCGIEILDITAGKFMIR